jgi:hypothetical protein
MRIISHGIGLPSIKLPSESSNSALSGNICFICSTMFSGVSSIGLHFLGGEIIQ